MFRSARRTCSDAWHPTSTPARSRWEATRRGARRGAGPLGPPRARSIRRSPGWAGRRAASSPTGRCYPDVPRGGGRGRGPHPGRAGGERAEQTREGLIAFTDDRDVDAVDRTDQFGAHLAVEVGTAEHRHQVRMTLLQPPGQRERRGVLLERRAEPGNRHLFLGKGVDKRVQICGDIHARVSEKLFASLFRRHAQGVAIHPRGRDHVCIPIGCCFWKGVHREQPLARHRTAMLAEKPVVLHADPHREVQVGMQRTNRKTASCR